ncbi:MAG: sugar ABC transporter permease [Clostridiales bacterium]|nr:sugar ABC transporter permease [Clostridiales bacterium]
MTVKPMKKRKYNKAETRTAFLCMLPSVIGLVCITYLPMIASFALSLFSWNGLGAMKYVGLANYVKLFTSDTKFYGSLLTTVQYAGMSVIMSIVYSMFIALLLNRKIPARAFFRAVFYLPYVLPAMAVYLGWKWLYDYNHGFFNYIVRLVGSAPIKFLDSSTLVTPSLAFIAVWLSGNLIVIFLAGLQNVPRNYHEAAEIDGANAWHRFWKITIPCMTPIIFYNLLMSLVSNLQVITPALSLTKGGPGTGSYYMCYMLYQQAFKSHKYGYGSAVAVILFILIAIFTAILFATSKSWIFYMGDDKE